MDDTKNNGGPAFPTQGYDQGAAMNGIGVTVTEDPGMTLRDWFAGQAMAGIAGMSGDGFSLSPEDEASWAYQRADAMIAARSAK